MTKTVTFTPSSYTSQKRTKTEKRKQEGMNLAKILKNRDTSDVKGVLYSFGTEAQILFTKSNEDRYTLWSTALLCRLPRNEEERRLKFEELCMTAQSASSPLYNQDLVQDIQQDITRLFLEEEEAKLSPLALQILHLWSRLNPAISYRQGMHELLRPILVVANEVSKQEYTVLDYDLFFMFNELMSELACLYEHSPEENGISPLQVVCQDIHNRLLQNTAPALKAKLESLAIEPQYFALRWLRCLFTREFSDFYLFGFWDVIFSQVYFESRRFSMIEIASYFATAMLLSVKSEIMAANNQAEALEHLLRFPAFSSEQQAVQLAMQALKLRNSQSIYRLSPGQHVSVDGETMKQQRLGARLEFIITELEAEITSSEAKNRDENKILQCLAQAKQIHDVLQGRLNEEDLYWG